MVDRFRLRAFDEIRPEADHETEFPSVNPFNKGIESATHGDMLFEVKQNEEK